MVAVFKPDYNHIAGFIDFDAHKIYVNVDDSLQRQNFTIAHELGQYLLGHRRESGYTVLLRNPNEMVKTPIEQEANCFAANLLVPEAFLRQYLDDFLGITNQQLSKAFGVSADVIRYRRLYIE
jgi:Zn-dependent peptidase ImmA (M78 family)